LTNVKVNLPRLSIPTSVVQCNFGLSKQRNIINMETTTNNGIVSINKQGAPSELRYITETLGGAGDHEVLIRQEAVALNFVDVLFRNGSFPLDHFPATIGVEAAGVVEAVGTGIEDFAPGDRVAYYFAPGAYAERRLISPNHLIKLPDDVSSDQAASLLAKGLTARMLVKEAYVIKPGDVVLVHAAAGGVGSLVSRWAKALGATVIGTVGNTSKKALALRAGLDYVIALDTENMIEEVTRYTNNQGVDGVFDGVGKATFGSSAQLVKKGATIVLYGTASGEPQIDPVYLKSKSIHLIRPALAQYLPDSQTIERASGELFQALRDGIFGEVKPKIYPLKEAAKAHQDLESGQTTGSIIFHP
jgi:NADPH2:quinone reductase